MAKVILSLNGNLQGEFVLRKERVMIGRKPENDISINNLAISGQHAVLISRFGDTIIEDLGSTNGTYINGELVKKQLLQSDDVISVGKHELTFVDDTTKRQEENQKKDVSLDSSNRTTPETLDKNIYPFTDQNTDQAAKTDDHINPHTANILQGKLHVLNGPIAGKELPLNRALVTLGKPGVQVAVISKRPQGYFLTHIEGNKEGQQIYPKVNGESIGAKAYTLENNDIIELAGIKMEFTAKS